MPKYVAGVDLEVLPIGFWSTSIALLKSCPFLITPKSVDKFFFLEMMASFIPENSTLRIKVDFPAPETPQQTIRRPLGIVKVSLSMLRNFTFSSVTSWCYSSTLFPLEV